MGVGGEAHRDIHIQHGDPTSLPSFLKKGKQANYGEVAFIFPYASFLDCLCGLAVRVPGYRCRDNRFDPGCYQIF
jgi:hypothetical protein